MANVLAVYLPNRYAARRPRLAVYIDGPPRHRLTRVLDRIAATWPRISAQRELAAVAEMSLHLLFELFKQIQGALHTSMF